MVASGSAGITSFNTRLVLGIHGILLFPAGGCFSLQALFLTVARVALVTHTSGGAIFFTASNSASVTAAAVQNPCPRIGDRHV
jgi:hypothetical protein